MKITACGRGLPLVYYSAEKMRETGEYFPDYDKILRKIRKEHHHARKL
ncbi:hypothetical protein [Oscillospiraceae bacterium]|nr:hypothetical protein [Oscillospiraceae bacterium]